MKHATEIHPGPAAVADETLADLRLRLRLSQRAFARAAGLTPAQVWLLEHGRVDRPQGRTAERYAAFLGIRVDEFFRAHLNTNRRFQDPAFAPTAALDRKIRDVIPRASSGQAIDLAGTLSGLGADLMVAIFDRVGVHWLELAATAETALRFSELRHWYKDPRTAVTRGALLCITELCRTAEDVVDAPSDRLWRERVMNVVTVAAALTRTSRDVDSAHPDPVDLSHQLDAPLRRACSYVLVFAGRDPQGFLEAQADFQVAWTDWLATLMSGSTEPDAIQSQVFALSDLLAGMAQAARDRVPVDASRPPHLVAR
jgi:transcriptional regulator with XRE-family HTH domain